MGGEKRPGIDCLRMHNYFYKNLGIHLHLEIVGTYTFRTIERCSRLPVEWPERRG